MSEPLSTHSSDERNTRAELSADRTGCTDIESIASLKEAKALERLLIKIVQDCRKEPLQYLERTKAWQHGE